MWSVCSTLLLFSHSVMSNSLRSHGLQHTRLPCTSPPPRVFSNSCPSCWWCHPVISASAVPFSSCLQSFQHQGLFQWASSSYQVAKLLELQHQSFNEYSGFISFKIDWFYFLAVQWTLKSSQTPQIKSIKYSEISFLYGPTLTSIHDAGKTIALIILTFDSKVISLLSDMLSKFVTAFLPRSKRPLISWLQSQSAVILGPKKIKSVIVSIVSPSICQEVMGPDAMILVFWMLNLKPTFSLSSFTFIKRIFSSSLLSAIRVVSYAYLRLLIFLLVILIPAYEILIGFKYEKLRSKCQCL